MVENSDQTCGKFGVQKMNRLTKEQGIVLTGYTGRLCCRFSDFHEDVEKRLGRPVYTHEFADKSIGKTLKELYRVDFMKLVGADASNKIQAEEA